MCTWPFWPSRVEVAVWPTLAAACKSPGHKKKKKTHAGTKKRGSYSDRWIGHNHISHMLGMTP